MDTLTSAALTLLAVVLVPVAYLVHLSVWPWIQSMPLRRKLAHLPGPPYKYPILGNVPDLVSKPVHQRMLEWAEQYGSVCKVELPITTAVVLTDPDAVTQVLKVHRFPKFTKSYQNMEKLTLDALPNVLTEDMGPYYRAVRRAVTPAFSTANLKSFFPTVLSLTDAVADHLAALGPAVAVDVDRVAQRLTVDVIGRFAFDRDFGATRFARNEALEAVQALMTGLQLMMNPVNRWFPWRKPARDLAAARRRFDGLVSRALADLAARPPAPHCLLAHLAAVTDPNTGKPLSPRRLKSETALFWIAGFETTAHAISWTLMFIAGDEEVQSRVEAELRGAGLLAAPGAPPPRALAWPDLGGLRYVNAAIHEALRLMPPASGGTARLCPADTQLGGHTVPKGAMVWIPFYALQRASHVWGADAGSFKPERWMAAAHDGAAAAADADEVVRAAGTYAARGWLPFSEGPRNCVGMSLAVLELRAAIAMLCGRFRFTLAEEMGGVEGAIAAARQHITLKPGDKGLLLHAHPRVPPAAA